MSDETDFADLMARLRDGDATAASLIFDHYAKRLLGMARSRLGSSLRGKLDPEDVIQSVFRSFFQRQAGGRMDVSSWNTLWGMLVVITMRKCGRCREYYHASRRNVCRETEPALPGEHLGLSWEGLADDPTPSEAAILGETTEKLLGSLDSRDRHILQLSLQGLTAIEICAQIGCTERTVYRVLERIKRRLQAWQAGEED